MRKSTSKMHAQHSITVSVKFANNDARVNAPRTRWQIVFDARYPHTLAARTRTLELFAQKAKVCSAARSFQVFDSCLQSDVVTNNLRGGLCSVLCALFDYAKRAEIEREFCTCVASASVKCARWKTRVFVELFALATVDTSVQRKSA